MVINSINICDDELKETLGSGLYLSASSLNHSCEPNCVVLYDGIKLKIKVIREFSTQNEEPTISYLDAIAEKSERQTTLQRLYYFKCECLRCSANSEKDIQMVSINCANCKTRIITINDLNGETTLQKCEACLESIEKSRELARQVKCKVNTIDKLERLLQMSPLDLQSKNNHKNAICVNAENIYVVKLLEKLMDLCLSAGRMERALEIAIHLTRSYEVYLTEMHPLLGIHYFKIGKLELYLENYSSAKSNLLKARKIIAMIFGEGSRIYSELADSVQQCLFAIQ